MVRTENQDCYGMFPAGGNGTAGDGAHLFIVADGMGGQRSGKLASDLAVRAVSAAWFQSTDPEVASRLEAAFRTANEAVFAYGSAHEDSAGMGTTCVALVLREQHACIAHIGDSRIYHIGKRGIVQLTSDHTKVAEMRRRGILTEEEALTHPDRHQLYRALGVRAEATVDIVPDFTVGTKEHFLLCTDGVYEYVTDQELHDLVTSRSPQEACDRIVLLANERGGHDNSTVCVVRVQYTNSFLEHMRWEQ
jgi:protein phosphatase